MRLWNRIDRLSLAGIVLAGVSLAGEIRGESPPRTGDGTATTPAPAVAPAPTVAPAPMAPPAPVAAAGETMDEKPKIEIGAVVPDFTLKDSEGKEVDLKTYRGDGVVVVTFLSKKCPVSHALHPVLASYAKEYGARGVKFLGIRSNVTEKTQEVAAAVREQGITFPVLDDPGYKIADLLDAMGTPHMYIIDREGKLRYSGAVCDNWKEYQKSEKKLFKDALDQVLAGKAVTEAHPDAFIGCTIKRSKQVG